MHENQSTIIGWQTIINDNVDPLSEPPELKMESSNIAICSQETLFWRYNTVQKVFELAEA